MSPEESERVKVESHMLIASLWALLLHSFVCDQKAIAELTSHSEQDSYSPSFRVNSLYISQLPII